MQLDLESIPFQETNHEGIGVHFFYTDRSTGHAAVMIQMQPGCSYPRHRHRGAEELLILRGGFRDESGEYRAGQFCRFEDGSVHHPVALPGDEPCVFFAIAQEGIDLLGDGEPDANPG